MSTPAEAQDTATFDGELNGITCERFIRLIRTQAFDAGKTWDNEWIAAHVSTRFDGPARRWYESLDHSVQRDWNALRDALLEQYALDKWKSIRSFSKFAAQTAAQSRLSSPQPSLNQPYVIDGRIRVSYPSQAVSEFLSCINNIYVLSPNERTALRVRVIYTDFRQSIATLNSRLENIGLMSGKGLGWPASTAGRESCTPHLGDMERIDPTPWVILRDGTICATLIDETGVNHVLEGWAFSKSDPKPLLFLQNPDDSLQTGDLSKLRLFVEPTRFHVT